MTKLRVGDAHTAVTLLQIIPQEVVRYKDEGSDGYEAVVIGVGKKELKKEKGAKLSYTILKEFPVSDLFKEKFAAGALVDASLLADAKEISLVGTSKGKGYQGVMKRFNAIGGPKTHGSKFHRHVGSMGNRKPRRVQKGHPHAGHMGTETVTLHHRPLVEILTVGTETLIAVKGSVPGAYNSLIAVHIK